MPEVIDAVIADFGARQHGLVTRAQLLAAGVGADAIRHRVRRRRLHLRHRGIYSLVAGELSEVAEDFAAILACGPRAALGARSAVAHYGLLPRPEDGVHVVSTVRGAVRAGIVRHWTRDLPAGDVIVRRGIPVTTLVRALIDFAGGAATDRELELALNEARIRHRLDGPALLARARGRPGAARLAGLLAAGPGFTRSEAERRLLRVLRRAALPAPRTNVRLGPVEVDALWADRRLVVEVDGFATHGSSTAFERDRFRDGRLHGAGYRVIRITWRQLTERPEAVAATLGAALSRAG